MPVKDDQKGAAARLARHRRRTENAGLKRLEVSIPASDAKLVRELAAALRAGGKRARQLRDSLAPIAAAGRARSGAELVAFFRASPLVGEDLAVERDRSPGRKIDL
jgi:hypothetical protein